MADLLAQNSTTTVNVDMDSSTTTEVMENLQNSEAELQDLNQQFDSLRQEYQAVVNNFDNPTFFNFDNVYFWFVIAGLLLLAFGLWWWLLELKKDRRRNKPLPEKIFIEPSFEDAPVDEPIIKKSSAKKVIKVKVRKVKRTD